MMSVVVASIVGMAHLDADGELILSVAQWEAVRCLFEDTDETCCATTDNDGRAA